jgi:hypothetical protein
MANLTSSCTADNVGHKTKPHKPGRRRVKRSNTHNQGGRKTQPNTQSQHMGAEVCLTGDPKPNLKYQAR